MLRFFYCHYLTVFLTGHNPKADGQVPLVYKGKKKGTFFHQLVMVSFQLCFLLPSSFFLLPSPTLAAPPQHFQTSLMVGSGLNGPSGFEIAPDGRIFILERTGKIKIFKNGQLLAQPFTELPSIASGDRGLIGIAFDPEFDINHYVYFYYTALDKLNYLVRFDASTDLAQNGPVILFQTSSPSELLHVGGSIRFGPDGKLYFAVGDNGYPPNAQKLDNPHGKIMRVNPNGTAPADNPFVNTPNALPEIWAHGFRNPWRFQFDSLTGKLYGGDVGDFTIEEVNHIVKGGNYGWSEVEGPCMETCPYINPIYSYPHAGESSAVTGGPVYRGTMFPSEYYGSLFFADYAKGFIKRLTLDEDGNSTGLYDFDLNAGAVVDLKVAHDGSMYYLTYFPGRLYRITYSTTNPLPAANAGANVTKGIAPLTVQFSSAGSTDPNNDPLSFFWEFGDGTTSTDANPSHTYENNGTYSVQLTVSDGDNQALALPITIQVGIAPSVIIGTPTNGATYRAGDEIIITAHATDGVGNDIDDGDYKTEIIFHHGTHIHPFLGPLTGRSHTFIIPDSGEPAPDTWFEILVTATDTNGLATSESVEIVPELSTLTFNTDPTGLTIKLDGIPITTPESRQSVVGYKRELSVPFVQSFNGVSYQFDHWSDGKAITHTIVTPDSDTSYTAHFKPLAGFQGEYYDNKDLTGEPVLIRIDPEINFTWNEAAPHPSLPTEPFSVRWTGAVEFIRGRFTFTTTTDDGVRLYIDNQLVIDQWHDQGTIPYQTTLDLAEGPHTIRMEYYEAHGGAIAKLSWAPTDEQPNPTPFLGEFWNTPQANSSPEIPATVPDLTQSDDQIQFDWHYDSPYPTIQPDHFVARWTKSELFNTDRYRFTIRADDGVRLYLDDQLVLDHWVDQAATTYQIDQDLSAGWHDIRLEYYENAGGAVVEFNVKLTPDGPPPPDPTVFRGEYWNLEPFTIPPVMPITAPDLIRNDTALDFVWNTSSPEPMIQPDYFVARWTKQVTLEAGTYEFSVTSDDGVRLYVDDVLVIDQWTDQAATTYTAQRAVTDGDHLFRMDYYEKTGGAVAQFQHSLVSPPSPTPSPSPSPTPNPTGFTAEYWNTPEANANPVIPVTSPTLTRVDSEIYFDWLYGSPAEQIGYDHFVVRWTKTLALDPGRYRFTVTADDGIRLKLDGETILDQWKDQGPTTYTIDQPLSSSDHLLIVEYYENQGGAVAKLMVEKIETSGATFLGEYWNILETTDTPILPTTPPAFTRNDPTVHFTWDNGSPDPAINPDHFVARWTKTEAFTAGWYQFTLVGDDGIRLFIDDELIIDQWKDQATTTYTVEKLLSAGDHTLRIEYYERTGGAVIQFSSQLIPEPNVTPNPTPSPSPNPTPSPSPSPNPTPEPSSEASPSGTLQSHRSGWLLVPSGSKSELNPLLFASRSTSLFPKFRMIKYSLLV